MSDIKFFVSHASADKEMVSSFVDNILVLGTGVSKECVAYTSDAGLGVSPGDNIPQYIKDNISSADLVLLMISENYRRSEVCMNELGAAWALGKKMVQILLPDVTFDKLGWLLSLDKALKITDSDCLDSLGDTISEVYGTKFKLSVWNRHKSDFLGQILSDERKGTQDLTVGDSFLPATLDDEEDLGLLDYSERINELNSVFMEKLANMTTSLNRLRDVVNTRSAMISKIDPSLPGRGAMVKKHIQIISAAMDRASDEFEVEQKDMKPIFYLMIDACIKVTEIRPNDKATDESDFFVIKDFMSTMQGCESELLKMITQMNSITAIEKSFISARKKLVKCISETISGFSDCRSKLKELMLGLV